jgi:hypothetical protein
LSGKHRRATVVDRIGQWVTNHDPVVAVWRARVRRVVGQHHGQVARGWASETVTLSRAAARIPAAQGYGGDVRAHMPSLADLAASRTSP